MHEVTATLASALELGTPIVLAAMGGLVNMRGGIVNIGLEGMMLTGAFVAVLVSWKVGDPWTATLCAGLAAGVVALPFSLVITRLRGNEIIVGLGFNILVAGLIGYLLPVAFGIYGSLNPENLRGLPELTIPVVDRIPALKALSGQTVLVYVAIASVPATAWFLRSTTAGIRLRASGEDASAARSAGVDPLAWRDLSTVIAGVFAGVAGAQLSIGIVNLFTVGMTAGRGYLALAAFYFGAARPWPTAAAAFLFALVDAIQVRLPGNDLPPQVGDMLPYLAVVFALTAIAVAHRRRERLVGAL